MNFNSTKTFYFKLTLINYGSFYVMKWILISIQVASGIHSPNLLTDYPIKLLEIESMCMYITPEHILCNFRCISIIGLEIISHFQINIIHISLHE